MLCAHLFFFNWAVFAATVLPYIFFYLTCKNETEFYQANLAHISDPQVPL